MKNGDCSRKRRLCENKAKQAWYASYRSFRFSTSSFTIHYNHGINTMKVIEEVRNLFETGEKSFSMPFPMGVFGTLRKKCSNHGLMSMNGKFHAHCRAFMPNFYAKGLNVIYNKESTAPFEIYFYSLEEWNKMIPSVDRLEGFNPRGMTPGIDSPIYGGGFYYHRTLAYLHIIPDEEKISNSPFDTNVLFGERDLKIPKETWDRYEKIPCWVYSNRNNNALCNGYPIIWG